MTRKKKIIIASVFVASMILLILLAISQGREVGGLVYVVSLLGVLLLLFFRNPSPMEAFESIPYPFVLELLEGREIETRKSSGVYMVVHEGKPVLGLRQSKLNPEDNGVWVGSQPEYFEGMKDELPSLVPLRKKPLDNWQLIPEEAPHFRDEVETACKMILRGDFRMGIRKV